MKINFRVGALVAGLVAMLWAGAAVAEPRISRSTLAQVDRVAAAWVAAGHTPGLTVGIMYRGRVIYLKGFGFANLETLTPATPESVFRIGSVTKQFTAVGILTLVRDGRIGLDDKLSKYLPDFHRADEVTIRQLLQHTSGINTYSDRTNPSTRWDYRSDLTTDQMLARIGSFQPAYQFDPGTAWHYNNSGYFILGAVIEKVTGKSLATYLDEAVLRKAGLSKSGIEIAADVVPNRASGYEVAPTVPAGYRRADFVSMTIPSGAGAMYSTVGDLLRWESELFAGRVIGPDLLSLVTTPARLNDGRLASAARVGYGNEAMADFEYGFGFFLNEVNGHKKIAHNGGINGFNSTVNYYPDDELIWVALSNTSGGVSDVTSSVGLGLLTGVSAQIETILLESPALRGGPKSSGSR